MITALFAAAAIAAAAAPPSAVAPDREVTIDGGIAPLHGSLRIPKPWRGGVVVLMQAGSGAPDRDGKSVQQRFFGNDLKLLADGLERAGYALLRIDKRCIGESALACPGEAKLTIGTYVEDYLAWAKFAAAQPGVRCVVYAGHSEGATVATLAAAKSAPCGLISLSGVGRPSDRVIEGQIKATGAPAGVQAKVAEIDAQLRAGRTVTDVPPALTPLYRPSLQPYLISTFAVRPTVAIAGVKAPVLVLQGQTDLQVSEEDARRLAAAQPRAKLVLLPGVNHILKLAPLDRAANLATYRDPELPLAPGVLPAVIAFIADLPGARR